MSRDLEGPGQLLPPAEIGAAHVEKSMSYKHLPIAERQLVFKTWKQWQLYPVPKAWVKRAIKEALINFRSS